ncbi:MAG: hypothetical protein KGI51_10175 [Rhodospirillales bacterium]|nr:hypothetical protein [Rhodospirillales bacterium]
MSTNLKDAVGKLKGLDAKLPKKVPKEYEKDYANFRDASDDLIDAFEDAAKADDQKDRDEYARKKAELDALGKAINAAAAKQKGRAARIQGKVSRVLDAITPLMKDLDGKKDDVAKDLSHAVSKFGTTALQEGQGVQDPEPVM